MAESAARETAAMFALLTGSYGHRTKVIREIVEVDSAVRVLERRNAGLLPLPDDPVEAAIHAAENQLLRWANRGIITLSIFDHRYPDRLRSIMQMPPS